MTLVLREENLGTERCQIGEHHVKAEIEIASTSQEMPRVSGNTKSEEESKEGLILEDLRRSTALLTP